MPTTTRVERLPPLPAEVQTAVLPMMPEEMIGGAMPEGTPPARGSFGSSGGAPSQQKMSDPGEKSTAIMALTQANLICNDYLTEGFDSLDGLLPANSSAEQNMCVQCLTCPCFCCCCMLSYLTIEPGCVAVGSEADGTNLFLGPGVHMLCKLWYSVKSGQMRVAEHNEIISGTKAIITVNQGYVGLALDKGEPIVLAPGLHQWNNPDICFDQFIDLSSNLIKIGPYTLITVEECYAAITQDNGKQKILAGGSSYMLTHQNWTFQTWLSLKMQTNQLGPLNVTTGDNINLRVVANVNWIIRDGCIAAERNVDASSGADSLGMIKADVTLQVTSSLASLVGSIFYGSQQTSGLHRVARQGMEQLPGAVGDEQGEPESENNDQLGRKALWDPSRLANVVDDANNICKRYGVEILSINLISAAPEDKQLVDIMSRGAVATVSAEETLKAARAEARASLITAEAEAARAQAAADAMLITARSEAESATIAVQGEAARAQAAANAKMIAAQADADAERTRAEGARDAGLLLAESEVATSLAKLEIAYGPFAENQSSTFFFGLQGPAELPNALLGKHLAAQTGTAGLALTSIAASSHE
eukprot:TRINITY_DN8464_c0_g1_i2.p1 TRINITY_DN8464_c0_g1~~TRINITY_DN8464_c0_g1_i2.p1  ORF type:complete len:591 (+),score=84.93 TRINITY_DN8464_c0_g1_i2:55-1827(+)